MLDKIKSYILKENLINRGDSIGVAVSGGIDSVVLLDLLCNLREVFHIKLGIIHFHHNVRPYGCETDKFFVSQIARDRKLSIIIGYENVLTLAREQSRGIEEVGRDARYNFFRNIISKNFCNKIAFAHTYDDQVETILMKILRGSGLKGLSGMSPFREGIFIRPLLEISRQEVEDYARKEGLCYRQDQTNGDHNFLRSRIRYSLLPLIKHEFNPNISNTLVRLSNVSRLEDDFLDNLSVDALKDVIINFSNESFILDANILSKYHIAMKRRVVRKAIFTLLGDLTSVDYNCIEIILEHLRRETGKILKFPGLVIRKEYNRLILSKLPDNFESVLYEKELNFPGETISDFFGIKVIITIKEQKGDMISDNFRANLDRKTISTPLFLRNRRKGDRFIPLGMRGKKKLKDFFIDEKVSKFKRDKVPLIADSKDIMWVVGMRIDDRFKIQAHTDKIVTIEVKPV
ncbi:MAG: tRNA(Ile)-lysidine synthase [bacterium ADurb.Bin363]|nr:MAG: tRNA(Ile)-lysidine synthase [bacterium ADurb.Bin363]